MWLSIDEAIPAWVTCPELGQALDRAGEDEVVIVTRTLAGRALRLVGQPLKFERRIDIVPVAVVAPLWAFIATEPGPGRLVIVVDAAAETRQEVVRSFRSVSTAVETG